MNRDRVISALRRHEAELRGLGVRSLALFGSTARGEASDRSDVDLVVDLDPSFRGFARLAQLDMVRERLEHILGRSVDLIEPPARSPRLRQEIKRDAVLAL